MSETAEMPVFSWGRGLAGLTDARAVRETVFIREQGFAREFDDTDRVAYQLTGWLAGKPVAAARLFPEPGSPGVWHAGRICVLKDERGRGLGLALMQEILRKARSLGATRVKLGAQLYAVPFYEKAGFVSTGQRYLDEGVAHERMERQLEGCPDDGQAAPTETPAKTSTERKPENGSYQ